MTTIDPGPDLDHPGYLRHCVYPRCEALFHAVRGPVGDPVGPWHMGRSGPIHGAYICPDHAPVVMEHTTAWITDEEPIVGTRCLCGWRWMPEARCPAGEHLEAWRLHLVQLEASA